MPSVSLKQRLNEAIYDEKKQQFATWLDNERACVRCLTAFQGGTSRDFFSGIFQTKLTNPILANFISANQTEIEFRRSHALTTFSNIDRNLEDNCFASRIYLVQRDEEIFRYYKLFHLLSLAFTMRLYGTFSTVIIAKSVFNIQEMFRVALMLIFQMKFIETTRDAEKVFH